MKKYFLIIALIFIFTACGQRAVNVVPSPASAPTAEPTVAINEFYNKIMNSNERPIAVMIDNDDSESRPHSGIEDAYLLYEMPVEGGSTRIMALFKDAQTEKIGPVRSSRHYFLDYAMENNAIYVHFGWSPKAQQDIKSLYINNINGVMGEDYQTYWREQKYAGDWHSAYTSIKNILANANKKGYGLQTDKKLPFTLSQAETELPNSHTANKLTINYASFYNVVYSYDSAKATYVRYINRDVHKTSKGVVLCAKNIIMQKARVYPLGDGSDRVQIDTVGKGSGVYLSGGKYTNIKWQKDSRSQSTKYYYENDEEVKLNPGVTYINLVAEGMKTVIE